MYLMSAEDRFDVEGTLTGMELEICLIDNGGQPALKNHEVLDRMAQRESADGSTLQDELGKYNLELNLAPQTIAGRGLGSYEKQLRSWLSDVNVSAQQSESNVVLVGTLPTITSEHATLDSLSTGSRYKLLNDQILAARGEEIDLDIRGVEHLRQQADSIAPESANTSVQFHLQLSPQRFGAQWNAAQAIAGVQLAMGANSPYLFGSRLWAETRIVLFEQSTDTRSSELRVQGVRPRTFFGEKWIGSAMDLFEENLRYFPPLLPLCDDEDPIEALVDERTPQLGELRLHNGTIYRWNRPVYDIGENGPHLRVENRTVPAGPTPVDICANMAFYLGLSQNLAEEDDPVWRKLPFSMAERNFLAGARDGIDARQVWPGLGDIAATKLVANVLLPKAELGLARLGVDPETARRYLSIIDGRCERRQNGASWQVNFVDKLQNEQRMPRSEALRRMLLQYREYADANIPVHEWPALPQ